MDEIRMIEQSLFRGVKKAFSIKPYNPPKTQSAWVNGEVLLVKKNRCVLHTDYLQVPPEWLGDAFLEEAEALKAANERAYRHEYLGEITGTGGNVFDNLNVRIITESERKVFDRHYNGLDFGFSVDPSALVRMHFRQARAAAVSAGRGFRRQDPKRHACREDKEAVRPGDYHLRQ